MRGPIVAVYVRIGDGVAAMNHLPVTHINTHMSDAVGVRCVVSMPEEYEITGLGISSGNRGADVVKSLRSQPSHIPAGMVNDP